MGRRRAFGKWGGQYKGLSQGTSELFLPRLQEMSWEKAAVHLVCPGPMGSCAPRRAAVLGLEGLFSRDSARTCSLPGAAAPVWRLESPSFPGRGALVGTSVYVPQSHLGALKNFP